MPVCNRAGNNAYVCVGTFSRAGKKVSDPPVEYAAAAATDSGKGKATAPAEASSGKGKSGPATAAASARFTPGYTAV